MDKSLEDALRFISDEIRMNPDINVAKLIDEASQKFDLDPMKTEFLTNKFLMER